MLSKKLLFNAKSLSLLFKRTLTDKNLLTLDSRGFFQDIFPDNAASQITNRLISGSQTIYAGFDPTADSLHIGNLLVLMGLLHCQRAGHQPIALLGGATGQIGDPSGRNTERSQLDLEIVDKNLISIKTQIENVFANHNELFWSKRGQGGSVKDLKIVNNVDWYKDMKLIDFISTIGRHFRMGSMLSRVSVQSRLKSESGMSFTEFTYQMFQAYDWWHLYKSENCLFQLGGSDQMGNLMSGHELISRVANRPVYGLTLPIVTNEEGDKFGKSAGNAIWLSEKKTSAFALYQFFIRISDSEVEKLLKLFTFLPLDEISSLMESHKRAPELREAQRKLAEEVTMLIHGEAGLKKAQSITDALYKGSVDALGTLSVNDVQQTLAGATLCDVIPTPGMTVLDLAMKAKCFKMETDAIRIINAGGFYVNQQRNQCLTEVISPSVHFLENGLTVLRVGKKNYHIIRWVL